MPRNTFFHCSRIWAIPGTDTWGSVCRFRESSMALRMPCSGSPRHLRKQKAIYWFRKCKDWFLLQCNRAWDMILWFIISRKHWPSWHACFHTSISRKDKKSQIIKDSVCNWIYLKHYDSWSTFTPLSGIKTTSHALFMYLVHEPLRELINKCEWGQAGVSCQIWRWGVKLVSARRLIVFIPWKNSM